MCRRAATPLVVVVERREVVVDEREGVDELERRRGRQGALHVASGRLGGGEAEHRPNPLAAALERIAHGLAEPSELAWQLEAVDVVLDVMPKLVRPEHQPRAWLGRARPRPPWRSRQAPSAPRSPSRDPTWPRGGHAPARAAPSAARRAGESPRHSRRRRLSDDSTEDAVHELSRLVRGIALGESDGLVDREDRKSTRLNSSHTVISYAVFCLKKKKKNKTKHNNNNKNKRLTNKLR